MLKSICIVRLSALGDVLMLVPLVRRLQDALPNVTITWIISRPAYYLVEGMDGVEFVVIDKPGALRDYWRFYQSMKGRHFDVLLATQASFRANLLYPLISAKRKIGYDRLRAKDGHQWFVKETIQPGQDHTLEGFLKFAEPLGGAKKPVRWDLPIDEASYAWATQKLGDNKPYFVVNPAASKPERSWSVERYIEVIQYVKSTWNMPVVLTGGPGDYDRQLADEILQKVECIDLVGKTKPKQLLAVISQAKAVLCPDTGPSHMACAVGTPVVALHAVTSPKVSGPYLYQDLAVDCYPEAVKTIRQSTLENTPWGTHAHGKNTMELVKVDAVIKKLEQVFVM